MPVQKCNLISGAPLTGKSTLAQQIAKRENAVLLSTDVIRDWMQNLLEPTDNPDLFFGYKLSPEEIHKKYTTPQSLLSAQLRQCKEVERGITALFETRYLAWDKIVLEGIALTPQFISELVRDYSSIKFEIIILQHNETSVRERLEKRGLWGDRVEQPDQRLEREIGWIELYDAFFKEELVKHNLLNDKL